MKNGTPVALGSKDGGWALENEDDAEKYGKTRSDEPNKQTAMNIRRLQAGGDYRLAKMWP